jgi:WD40 repeat protein
MAVSEAPPQSEAPQSADPGRYDAFLSYAREDENFVVGWLLPALRYRQREVWVDVDIAGGAQWRDRVKRGIEACKAVIFVVTPASVASHACRGELEDAVALNKLIIPVVHRGVQEGAMPAALADAEWVLLRDGDDPAVGLDRLGEALDADLDWRDQHTRLAGRAREWLDSGGNSSYLLRGADLRDAETWFAQQEGHREAPTRAHGEYIARSRQAAGRRLYLLIGTLSAGLLVALGLAVFALVQRQNAIHQTHAAQSRALAASSLLALGDDPELSLLLARGAVREQNTPQAREALRSALATSHVRRTMTAPNVALGWAWFTPDGSKIVANGIGPSYVFDATTGRLVRTLYDFRYKRPMFKSQLSGDGSHFLILPNIGPAVVMDVSGRTPPVKLIDPTDSWFVDAALAPNGRFAVAITLHTDVTRIFDTDTGRVLRTLPGRFGRVALSDDGTLLALATRTAVVTYNAATGAPLAVLPAPAAAPYPDIAFSPDGALWIVTADAARAWDPVTGRLVATLQGLNVSSTGTGAAWPLAFSRNGATVAGVTAGGQAAIWDAKTGRMRAHIVPAANDDIFDVALSPNGAYVATADGDGIGRVWSTTNAALITELRGVAGGITNLVFAPDGRRVLTSGEDGTARIWDAGLGLPNRSSAAPNLLGGPGGALRARWALATAGEAERNIPVFDSISGRQAFIVKLHRPSWSVVLAARAPVMAVVYKGAPVELWNMAKRQSLGSLPGTDHVVADGEGRLQAPALSADGRRVMIAAGDTLTVWDVRSRRPLGRLHHRVGAQIPASASSFSPDDQLLATIGTDGVVVLWRASDGHVIAREQAERSPGFNASVPVPPVFSPDGSLVVAAGNWDRSPGVWRTSDGRLVSKLTQSLNTVAFSPNAPLIVTDGGLVWDAESGRLLLTLRDPVNGIDDAAFTPDGLHVIADALGKRDIFSCDICGSLPQLLHLANQRITRGFTLAERDRYLR